MIAPFSFYRRIEQIDERATALSPQLFMAAGFLDEMLDHLPDDERREVLRLTEEAFDIRGQLDWDRLTTDQRIYIHERLTKVKPD